METEEKSDNRLEKDLKKDLVSYISGTDIEGIRYIVEGRNHGFRYIIESRSMFERVVWGIVLAISFYVTFSGMMDAYQHWDTHPVGTTKDEVGLPIEGLHFPAISVNDPRSLTMPRKNRWMFVETLLNSLELVDPEEELKYMYPGKKKKVVSR